MRIPVPIVIGVSLAAVALSWWLRTKDMDFLTPSGETRPLPQFMTDPESDSGPPEPVQGAELAEASPPSDPPIPSNPDLDLGDLESSPGLAEYSEHAGSGAGYLLNLATELELKGYFARSLLAWERVIDSCHPSPPERKTAEDAVTRIRPSLPGWNIDPAGDIPLVLQLRVPHPASGNLKQAMQEAADFLRRDSDLTLLIEPRITSASSRGSSGDTPLTISFSGSGDGERQVRSLSPGNDEIAHYRLLILNNAYQLVRQELLTADGIVPPQPRSNNEDPALDFQRQISRLHWLRFAESLNRAQAANN